MGKNEDDVFQYTEDTEKTEIIEKTAIDIVNDKSKILQYIENFIEVNKCNNVKSYRIKSMNMWFVVASVDSDRQANAIVKNLLTALKEEFLIDRHRIEGDTNWVILDVEDVFVHIFRTEVREYYNVDLLWSGNEKSLNTRLG